MVDSGGRPHHYTLFSVNRGFVGQEGTLTRLREMLFTQKECQTIVLIGLEGVGKT